MENNSDATPDTTPPPGPIVGRTSRGGVWLGVGLLVIVALIYLAKGMM